MVGKGDNMGNLKGEVKTTKCPKCLNKMSSYRQFNGDLKGTCSVCRAVVITKQHSNETLIRIVNNK